LAWSRTLSISKNRWAVRMKIKTAELKNFRNHASTRIALGDTLNFFVGNNAQGKTNLLEGIYMTCVGCGFRAAHDSQLIRFGQTSAKIKTSAERKFGAITIEIEINAVPNTKFASKKQIKINEIPIQKMGELIGTTPCVFFNPDELKLIKEAPADRRKFLNIDISQLDRPYFYALMRYNKILKQRNALLKSFANTDAENRSLDIWDSALASEAEKIIARRRAFVAALAPHAASVHTALAAEALAISYEESGVDSLGGMIPPIPPAVGSGAPVRVSHSTAGGLGEVTSPNQSSSFLSRLRAARENDIRLRTTTIGPHRDDLSITINGQDARLYGSQGQQRTAALALKVAELRLFESNCGERPILLLDDVFSELDTSRQKKLLALCQNTQTIITTAIPPRALPGAKIFNLNNGGVTPR
jgi:DNA replication and repair protein RecF